MNLSRLSMTMVGGVYGASTINSHLIFPSTVPVLKSDLIKITVCMNLVVNTFKNEPSNQFKIHN